MKELDFISFAEFCDYFVSTQGGVLRGTKVPLKWISQTLQRLKEELDLFGDYELAAADLPMRAKCVIIAAIIEQCKESGESKGWLVQYALGGLRTLIELDIPEDLICAANYLLTHGRMPSKKYITERSPYRLKVVFSDVSHFPHGGYVFETSVWKGDTMVPIGHLVRDICGADESEIEAISQKYGSAFVEQFRSAISVLYLNLDPCAGIKECTKVFTRFIEWDYIVGTVCMLSELKELSVEVEDARSKAEKEYFDEISKLMSSIEDIRFLEELISEGRLTTNEVAKILSESYGVSEGAAETYVSGVLEDEI